MFVLRGGRVDLFGTVNVALAGTHDSQRTFTPSDNVSLCGCTPPQQRTWVARDADDRGNRIFQLVFFPRHGVIKVLSRCHAKKWSDATATLAFLSRTRPAATEEGGGPGRRMQNFERLERAQW
jgi:hypothetical protein